MSAINRRIQLLEQARPAGQLHPPGVRTVKFAPFRGRNGNWPPGGFDLVELRPAKRGPGPIVFETESVRRMSAARERLIELPRAERARMAKTMGCRVVYLKSIKTGAGQ